MSLLKGMAESGRAPVPNGVKLWKKSQSIRVPHDLLEMVRQQISWYKTAKIAEYLDNQKKL